MPILADSNWERFAQLIVAGDNGPDAYIGAGFKAKSPNAINACASRLLKNAKIAARISELQSRAASDILITRQKTLEELASIAYAPLGHEHVKSADKRAALVDIARIEGWVIERSEAGKPGDFGRLSDDELDGRIEETARGISGAIGGTKAARRARAPVPSGRPN